MLGGAVARALAARGDQVRVLQRRPAGLGLPEVLGDVADLEVVLQAADGQDAVVHLAAKVDIVGPWAAFARANVGGTTSVVLACQQLGVGRLVQVSSPSVAHAGSSLVGVGAGPADPAGARSPYARSKAMAELVALAADSADLAVVAVRPHVVWGPGDPQLVARIVDRARRGRMPVVGTGAALVDSTYVDNAVDALLQALDRAEIAHGQAVVVTNGEPRPISELIGAFAEAAGAPRPSRHIPVRLAVGAGSVVEWLWAVDRRVRPHRTDDGPPLNRFLAEQLSTAHWFDQRHTRELLDWSPRVGLDEGLERLRRSFAG